MNLTKYFERFERLHRLIGKKATGSPVELADIMNLSERAVFDYIKAMREMGAPISFCHNRRTYFYEREVQFNMGFRELNEEEKNRVDGGHVNLFSNYFTDLSALQK
ncbi:HTH domain-containing protein [Dyadobacter sp. 3J3]|uniref:HTH domain-containing protein n=1 Tax=Dyadobacter sp. 3J3 TaxID=2606600 RepID=UPI0013569B7C|nr:HTH domain-containing protein [Dyadobacter sp. 3J3]